MSVRPGERDARSRALRCLSFATALAAGPRAAWPQGSHTYIDPIDQQPRDCYASPRAGGALMLVEGQRNNSLRFWAYSTWDGAGHPLMIFNMAVLSQLPPIVTRFAFYHECAHLVLRSTDEVQANCEALKQMAPTENCRGRTNCCCSRNTTG